MATTEFAVDGANCPQCFNETLDALRAQPGVVVAAGSLTDQCVRVEHDGADVDQLLGLVRRHLHADVLAAREQAMGPVDARIEQVGCTHGHGAP
ncbi:MAG: hypothetical protein K1X95_09720 [Acidimicrobiia bacterium]|nr:hypothetical protein [Acidimicrobiia bacterium]